MADDDDPAFLAMQARVRGTNISPDTLLATDYLNHFNEIIMMLDMVPDMPDLVEDCAEWQPKSYPAHFADSTFRDKDLAIEAYDYCPARFREPFDATIAQMEDLALTTVSEMQTALAEGNTDSVTQTARLASRALQRLMDMASAIIHGAQTTMDQSEIDTILGH
ncbi:hypothetical protein F1188_18615 [Roseospira marina]|uniref:Uncharacterized protein n=1 Tax=Roseospira marina TaxID=140057 RepID=A0A5M6I6L8_9PROT|nr:hypothetical protein F1188_18615 [Roseospira marina]